MPIDELAIVRRLNEARTPQQLADILRNPRPEEARALETWFGPVKLARLRVLAFALDDVRGDSSAQAKGNVVVLPGIMGSELDVRTTLHNYNLWLNIPRIGLEGLDRLELDAAGSGSAGAGYRVSATGLLSKYYGEIVLTLGRSWNVRAFPYDWRSDLDVEAAALLQFIRSEFAGEPVSLVGHSMGGLVARALWGMAPKTNSGGPLLNRLIMLGTPNFGSFEVPLIFSGIQDTVKKLTWLTHPFLSTINHAEARRRLLAILSTFPGVYQMLPRRGTGADALTKASAYSAVNASVVQGHLDRGVKFLDSLKSARDPARMSYIAGYGIETIVGVDTGLPLDRMGSYWASDAGDGRVPHELGLLEDVPTYYVAAAHGDLPANAAVLAALPDLLETGDTTQLPKELPADRALTAKRRPKPQNEDADADFGAAVRGWADRSPSLRGEEVPLIDPEAARIADEVLAGWISDGGAERSSSGKAGGPSDPPPSVPRRKLSIRIRIVSANISECHVGDPTVPPIDAVAVGMYENQRKAWAAIKDIDKSIQPDITRPQLLSDLIERGTVRGVLAVPTLIPDPRSDDKVCRHIVLVGMGAAGQFGPNEARQASRELAWCLGRVGKKHLATILIGAGRGNVSPNVAMRESLKGLARALNDSRTEAAAYGQLKVVTFVEYYPDRIREMHEAVVAYRKEIGDKYAVEFVYDGLSDAQLKEFDRLGVEKSCKELRERIETRAKRGNPDQPTEIQPTRIIVEQVQDAFWFSAMTDTASIPQRQVEIDLKIVDEQNALLVAAANHCDQAAAGRVLGQLLIPHDFRNLFAAGTPIVLDVDTSTARIHWELIVHDRPDTIDIEKSENQSFLALQRGCTRQLRTRFAPAPEPQPTLSRIMKALVIADPAADARLPGAQREGIEVVEIFKAFNRLSKNGNRIDVTELIGPGVATRVRVLGELLSGQYDILHFAGHCYFDPQAPLNCGWLFQRGATLADRAVIAARELRRVDRLPRFIFSNACESGIMPFRPEDRASGLTAAFAETFFERGAINLICTGWPVNDRAARQFAREFYGQMLGLVIDSESAGIEVTGDLSRELMSRMTMSQALMHARGAVREIPPGCRTWGAYQHYGNPFTKFFLTAPDLGSPPPAGPAAAMPAPADAAPPPSLPAALAPKGAAGSFDRVRSAIAGRGAALRSQPGVIDVRPGYRFQNDWITNEPAIVVVVADPARVPVGAFPKDIGGVPVELRAADPFEQIQADAELRGMFPQIAPREFLAPGTAPVLEDEAADRSLTDYQPPADADLSAITSDLKLTCHVSPDCGFPVLADFLAATEKTLTVAMYDFTAPHIQKQLRAAVRPVGRSLALVLDPQLSLSDGGSADNPKANDVSEDEIVEGFQQALGSRFDFAWAAVTKQGKVRDGIFPKAYHIKVAVRDGTAFWLSSGNWQSSNQPPLEVMPRNPAADFNLKTILGKYNREWHCVIEDEALAGTFEKFIKHDLAQAKPLQVDGERGLDDLIMPELLVPIEGDDERGLGRVEWHKPLVIQRKVKVRPVLTPDNYPEVVADLIAGATKSIRFQNQYINIGATVPPGFLRLLEVLKAKCADAGVKVQIILRRIGDVNKMLEALQAFGFDATDGDLFRLQASTHTKGIVVDDRRVLVGSHNWSGPGATRNRDASLLFDDPDIAGYYAKVFDHDWEHLAKAKTSSSANHPRVAEATRDATTPPGMIRIPWNAYFEDVDDI